MKQIIYLSIVIILFSCNSTAQQKNETKPFPITKSDAEWKTELTDLQFYILRKSGTERQFSSPLNKNYDKGIYVCAACETPLFESNYKYDSKSGWPSFDREIKGNVDFYIDYNIGYARSEEHCSTCGGHLGHVFNDGPKETTGLRHCVNGAALKFIPKKDE